MNCFMTDCVPASARSGYVAATLCSKVQLDRPNSSTSGGQSDLVETGAGLGLVPPADLAISIHAETEVHVRHLMEYQYQIQARCSELTVCHFCPGPRLGLPSAAACPHCRHETPEIAMLRQKVTETTFHRAISPSGYQCALFMRVVDDENRALKSTAAFITADISDACLNWTLIITWNISPLKWAFPGDVSGQLQRKYTTLRRYIGYILWATYYCLSPYRAPSKLIYTPKDPPGVRS